MKIKTSELTGIALDWAVERAMGTFWSDNGWFDFNTKPGFANGYPFQAKPEWFYSADWSHGGAIIKRERIEFRQARTGMLASYRGGPTWFGEDHLIAAMRCFVASKLGKEVEVPDELA